MKVQRLFAGRRVILLILFAILAILLLTASTTEAAPEQSCGFYHHVQFGQTLGSIAAHYGVSVNALMHANPYIHNPNLIYAGTNIYIPCAGPGHPGMGGSCSHVHYVQYGQTLSQIAWRYHVPVRVIMQANGLHNPNLVYAGTNLCIP